MGRKIISLLLVLCLVLSCGATAFAVEEQEAADGQAELEAWEAALGGYTETDANAYTPVDAENLLDADPQEHAYDPTPEEEPAVLGDHVDGEVLFARKEGGLSLFSDGVDEALAELGISNAEVIWTEPQGEVSLFGLEEETVWYQAQVSGSVAETVEALNEVDGIVAAEPNYIYTADSIGEPEEAEKQPSWFLHTDADKHGLSASSGWKKAMEMSGKAPGTGAVVAVIDTGVDYTHEDLASSMWVNAVEYNGVPNVDDDGNGYIDDIYGIDATANPRFDGAKAGDPMDYNGHGTHVAGIIAMSNNKTGGVGIAYGAKIMALKAGQATGTFSSADIAEAIQYAVSMGADVINMSFGGTGRSSLMEDALEDAFATCVLVAAAGNDGVPTVDAPPDFIKKWDIYPAAYNYVLGVMASDQSGNLASFSNWDYYNNANAEYELAAPGVNIFSTLPGNRYANWNGTSMAAPCVAASAAILRSCYTDKDEYNSRFIMGQLASATDSTVTYVDKFKTSHIYAKLDLYDSLTKLPQPNLIVSKVFALDNVTDGTENDGDRIMDAGEVIDLGISVRNQWGKSGEVTIVADAVSNGGVANPYVEFINDTITLSPIGAFFSEDNGYVYEDSYLTSVENPIQFRLVADTPNDTELCINLTVTTTNGWDKDDNNTYRAAGDFTFRVQKGKAVRGHISEDTVWDNDHYWIVENSVIVDKGATLTVEPGTQIQFWSSDYDGAYGGKTMAYIKNNGTLNMIGSETAPIECFPGAKFEQFAVEIFGNGVETLKYCIVQNARIGETGDLYRETLPVDLCDHCVFTQNNAPVLYRYFQSNEVGTSGHYLPHHGFTAKKVTNSRFVDFGSENFDSRTLSIVEANNNQYDECAIELHGTYSMIGSERGTSANCVFLGNRSRWKASGGRIVVYGVSSPNTVNSAVLNPVLNTNPDCWLQFVATSYNTTQYNLSNNYWGTENKDLINLMIQDDDDFAGTLANIVEDPILTLEDDLSDIYPFVTKIWVTEENGTTPVTETAPGVTYEVHVAYNRDMDQEIQPMVTYGGEAPLTDYLVHGDWASEREWVGTTKISNIATGGTQIFRAKGGAAADDNWLVCGTDEYRFQFDIESTAVKSMVLNATGGINKIDLMWAQNDYDMLAGYNLYRSSSADGSFTKLNDAMLSETTYTDTDVEPGKTYYYYFTVVDTDGNEILETKSNVASAAPRDNVKPVLAHDPISSAKVGQNITIAATATDNIGVKSVTLYYKTAGEAAFTAASMTYNDVTGVYSTVIPGTAVTAAGVQYYIEASDTTGNKAWSGSATVPYAIVTDNAPTLLAVFPATVNIGGSQDTMTVYGTNLTQELEVTVGTTKITEFTVNEDGTELTFATPTFPVGKYSIRVASNGKSAVLANALEYRDVASFIQINSATVTSGDQLRLPLYVGMSGELTAFHAEIQVPADHFSGAKVELAETGSKPTLNSSYRSGKLTISMASANDFNPGSQKPLAYLVLTPKAVSSETAVELKLTSGKLNGAETVDTPIGPSVVIYPNFALNATVRYFKDDVAVPGVEISAAAVKGTTDADGKAALTGITRADVTVLATKEGYSDTVEAYDAVLVLQHCVSALDTPLDESQLIAGDVDGNGEVDEVDASLILKKYAKLIEFFPAGSWKFSPASQTVSLNSTAANVTFTAIMVGDVDGSWASGE